MKTRTLLVDASNLLKRSFHGAKDVQTTKFGHIGGLYSFFTSIRKLIKQYQINKVVLAWDGEGGGVYRYRIDREYKANRKNKEWYKKIELTAAEIRREKEKSESILKQRMRIQAYAEELFMRQIEIDDIEADDLIAKYCLSYNNLEEIFLLSNDRDFAQLLDLNICMLISTIDEPVTKLNYMMYFNHYYKNALVMKIVCGDTSDNIKGIAGMGETVLLKHFPQIGYREVTVREICIESKKINEERILNKKKPIKVFESLLANVDRLKINHQLVNLREPILNENAIIELENLKLPLSSDDRNSKNLYNMMVEDEFLTIYKSTFVQYIEPFYSVIMNEKELLKEFQKK
jgi:5'-3' exonuclease